MNKTFNSPKIEKTFIVIELKIINVSRSLKRRWGSFSTIAFSFPRPSTIPFWTNLLVMSNNQHLWHTWIWEPEFIFKNFNKYYPKSIKLRQFEFLMLRMETGTELLMANNGASVSICGARTTLLHAARNKNCQMVHKCSYSWDLNP